MREVGWRVRRRWSGLVTSPHPAMGEGGVGDGRPPHTPHRSSQGRAGQSTERRPRQTTSHILHSNPGGEGLDSDQREQVRVNA